ncbi:MAG TPA: DUF3631 domain-containing protein, partial [Acidobacteria bacterium]|nr:DUF3631 domain-containing protein [Acidobacteriota bacterium]
MAADWVTSRWLRAHDWNWEQDMLPDLVEAGKARARLVPSQFFYHACRMVRQMAGGLGHESGEIEYIPYDPIPDLPDTLADRAVTVALRRKRPDERVERLRLDRMNEFESLRRQAARRAEDNLEALRVADPNVPFDLHDRAADNCRGMLAIADRAGG